MPVGKAVTNADESDSVEKSVEPVDDAVHYSELRDVLTKSIDAMRSSELPENMVKVQKMQDLFKSVKGFKVDDVVEKSFIDKYNEI